MIEEAVMVSCEAEINGEEQGSEGQGECWGWGKTGSDMGRQAQRGKVSVRGRIQDRDRQKDTQNVCVLVTS